MWRHLISVRAAFFFPFFLLVALFLAPIIQGQDRKEIEIDSDSIVRVGIDKSDVTKLLGKPTREIWVIKDEKAGPPFGVISRWWPQLKKGDKVEILQFSQKDGQLEVYFLNGSKVWHTAFVPKGVVF